MHTEQPAEELTPTKTTIKGLNGLLFFISDIRNGIGPLLAIHLRNTLHWDPAKIGMALAAVEVSAFCCQIPAGLLADAARRKRSIIALACTLIIIGCFIILSSSSFSFIMLAQFIMGICIALIGPTMGSITMGLFGRKRFPKRMGQNEVWTHFGNVFAALSLGLSGFYFGSQFIFFLVILLACGSLCFLTLIRPQEIHYEAARELAEDAEKALPLADIFKRKSILIFNVSLILYYITNGAQMSLVGQILAQKAPELSALFITGTMLIAEMTMIGTALVMSRIVNRFNRKTLFLTAFLILPIRATLYALVETPYLFLLIQVLDGIAAGIMGVMGAVINADLATGTGRFNFLQGLGGMSTSIGESISLIFTGFIAASFGFDISFLTLASIGLMGIAFFSFAMPETKKAQ